VQTRVKMPLNTPEPRQFAHGQRVTDGNGGAPEEAAAPLHVKERAFCRGQVAAQRIGPVQHDQSHAGFRARLQHMRQRPDVGVEPRADVRQVEHHGVQVRQRFTRRAQGRAVETDHRQAGQRVETVGHRGAISGVRAGAVLGRKQAYQAESRPLQGQARPELRVLGGARGVVGDQPQPARQPCGRGEDLVNAEPDSRHAPFFFFAGGAGNDTGLGKSAFNSATVRAYFGSWARLFHSCGSASWS